MSKIHHHGIVVDRGSVLLRMTVVCGSLIGLILCSSAQAASTYQRMAEWTIESRRAYTDPFNDVDVDVVFSRGDQSWRVPTFWRGGHRWTVRFAPPAAGEYLYRLESTDRDNPDLNGHAGRVVIRPYVGSNALLTHGAPRVSASKRYFEYADGTPFYWLGDTLWNGLSDRLPWEGFKTLTADRQGKGFTVMQLCAGLVPFEEKAPVDPGFANEGGAVWDPDFKRINPRYFDFADRRVQRLVEAGITPAIVGGWNQVLAQIGPAKLKQHWRYIIARYGAYPVFWVVGGEVFDPPKAFIERLPVFLEGEPVPGWTDIARYVRATDPYHHPLTAHEESQGLDVPLQDRTVTDFDLIQTGHFGWSSVAAEVAQLSSRYSDTDTIKPYVVGEIGYELIGGTHLEDFQRTAFWLAMLNGAAGFTYGAAPTYESNNPAKPIIRGGQNTFLTWREGMSLPGSYQVGLSAKFLQQYPWWQFTPHPEWITPAGTTLLEPHAGDREPDPKVWERMINEDSSPTEFFARQPEALYPGGEWQERHGNFRAPYAAGVPGQLRVVYLPYFSQLKRAPPTILSLEEGVRYSVFYWEPMLGIKVDLGAIERPGPAAVQFTDNFTGTSSSWSEQGHSKARRSQGQLIASGETFSIADGFRSADRVVNVNAQGTASAGILLRYKDADNFVAAVYSTRARTLYVSVRKNGVQGPPLGETALAGLGAHIHLEAEMRGNWAAASVTDGVRTYATPIVDLPTSVRAIEAVESVAGLLHEDDGTEQRFSDFEIRQNPLLKAAEVLQRKLYDAKGMYRGELSGPGWDDYGRHPAILLGSYRPEIIPSGQDWVLVMVKLP